MEQFVGLDISEKLTNVCVVDREGAVVWRGSCLSTPDEIAATIRLRASRAVRIGLETGHLSTWLWHALHKMGLPVVCIDARHAKAALSMQTIRLTGTTHSAWLRSCAPSGIEKLG